MRRITVFLCCAAIVAACASADGVVRQNLGRSRQVKPGMTKDTAFAVMGTPAQTTTLLGVEEWRYCATARRGAYDEFVVLYLQNGLVIEKASYTIYNRANDNDGAVVASCLESMAKLYTDGRHPPRRVQEIRKRER